MELTKYQKNAVKQAINKQIDAFKYERKEAKGQGFKSFEKAFTAEIKTLKKAKRAIKKA
jgi:hypothetical protein